jgi:protein-ribulosamine 3-kinase
MEHMISTEESRHGPSPEITSMKDALLDKVIPRLLRPLATNGRTVTPTLIHSDIHHDNVKDNTLTGETMLFDSCAFWGHNECELATWRSDRYQLGRAYIEEYVRRMGMSEPREDFDDRNKLYWLRFEFLSSVLHPHNPAGRERAVQDMRELVLKYPKGYEGHVEDERNAAL